MYFWKRRKIKIKIIFKSFTFNTKNDKLIAKLKILTKTKKHLHGIDIPCYCWLRWSKEISVRISLDVPQKGKKCSFACRRHIPPLFQISGHLFMFFSYLRLPVFFFKYLFFEYSWKVKIEIKRFQFYVEVYRHKSFTSRNLLFQLEDLVSDKATSFPWDELDHKGLKVPYIG